MQGSDEALVDVPASARAVMEIDLSALQANWRLLAHKAAPAQCAAVVKADAYGLGAARCASAMIDAGCETFFVATLDEALALRDLTANATIYVLDGLLPGTCDTFIFHDLRPVLSSLPEVSEWVAACVDAERLLPAAIQVDTGMARLGLTPDDVAWLADERGMLVPFRPSLVISHLAAADDAGDDVTREQEARFREMAARLRARSLSLANSAGTLWWDDLAFHLVRPGIALYGGQTHAGPNPLANVVRYFARILQVRTIPAGARIGYGGKFVAARPSRIATLASGYADGYPRAAVDDVSGRGPGVFIAGQAAPVVGRVSMDMITVDVTDLAEDAAQRGGWAQLIGPPALDEIAAAAGTIDYEILTHLGRRAHRIYRTQPAGPASTSAPSVA